MLFKGQFNVENKNIVITGGSQGLGAELAKQFTSLGAHSVTLIARREKQLERQVEELEKLRTNETQEFRYVAADLAVYEEAERAVESLEYDPEIVVLCAGSSLPKLFGDLSGAELEQGVAVNYHTSLYFSHAVFKRMSLSSKKERHIVFCSSVLAVFPFIGYSHYAPAKAAIRALSDILRHEALPHNIKVSCVFPGNFASEGYAEEEKTKPAITKDIEGASAAISVQECAQNIIWWLDRGYDYVYTDFIGWALSCGALGMSPRVLGFLQVLVSLLLSIIAPIYMIITRNDIRNYFKKHKKE